MLILVEEWKEGLQQCEGRTNKMYNNAVMIEKKYFHPQVFSFIGNYLIQLSKAQ